MLENLNVPALKIAFYFVFIYFCLLKELVRKLSLLMVIEM